MRKSLFSLFALFGLLNVVKEICLWKDREAILNIQKTGNLRLILSPGVIFGEQWKTLMLSSQGVLLLLYDFALHSALFM